MIAILVVTSLLQLSTAAVVRQPDTRMLGLDDSLGSLLYEIPDYEDPQMLEYELSQLENHPIVSLIHLARKHVKNQNKHSMSKEAIANFKLNLDSVITRLQTLQERLENGSTDIPVEDIEKSIQDLQILEHIVKPNLDQLMTAMHRGMPHSVQHSLGKGGLLNVRSKHPQLIEVTTLESDVYEFFPLTTASPVHEKKLIAVKPQVHEIGSSPRVHEIESVAIKQKVHEIESSAIKPEVHEIESSAIKPEVHEIEPLATKAPVHEIEPPATKPPVYKIESPVTKPPVHEPAATEEPVFALAPPATEAPKDTSEEEVRIVPYKDQVFKSEAREERYEMNPYQSRWTWKTSSFKK